jgi:hypothetical protein
MDMTEKAENDQADREVEAENHTIARPRGLKGLMHPATDGHHKALDAILFGAVSVAAVAAFVFQSVERFADREHLFLGGMFVVFALIASLTFRIKRGPVLQLYGVVALLVFAAGVLFMTGSDAVTRSDWNDKRCLRLQSAMLNPSPNTRDDVADVFAALQCRPQGIAPAAAYAPQPDNVSEETHRAARAAAADKALIEEVRVEKGSTWSKPSGGKPEPSKRSTPPLLSAKDSGRDAAVCASKLTHSQQAAAKCRQ